jgi:signal transduction histidine kinase
VSQAKPRWWADTLSKRLFVLLWVTLVGSHLLGFWLASPGGSDRGDRGGPRQHGHHAPDIGMQVLPPFLPPGPLLGGHPPHGPGRHGPDEGSGPRPGDAWALPASQPGSGTDANRVPFWGDGPDEVQGQQGSGLGAQGARDERGPRHAHPLIWLDYLARVLVMGAAAWLGARWLTAPMRQLTAASQALGLAMGRGGDLPLLDEAKGPQEVRQTARVFNGMARGLRDQFEQRSLMMAAVSHDLRTPLTRLRMRLEKLRPDPVAERCVDDVRDINELIDAVLDAMNEERRQEAQQAVDVLALVQAMADDLQEAGHAVTAQGDAATLHVQPVAFKRVLSNLISNAVRYGHGADIVVTVQRDPAPGLVRITIDDRGPGIAPDQLEAVFKPFVRLDTSRSRETGGVGLGLYIARELAHRHGGQITLSNRPGGGLRAELVLPRN